MKTSIVTTIGMGATVGSIIIFRVGCGVGGAVMNDNPNLPTIIFFTGLVMLLISKSHGMFIAFRLKSS